MDLAHGGHLTHGCPVNFSGFLYNTIPYQVRKDTQRIDYDQVRDLAKKHSPKMIIAGGSAYPRAIDFKLFIVYAGEDFFKSDYYEYDGETGEEQVLKYLFYEHYDKVRRRLEHHYKDSQILSLELIEDQYFHGSYMNAVENKESYEDCFDYVESMKLYQWAAAGFSWSGEA